MLASFNGPDIFEVENGRVLDGFVERAVLGSEGGMFICRQLPCIQLCWPQEERLPPLDTICSWRPIAGLTNGEVDFTQKQLDFRRLGDPVGSSYGESLVCVLKHVICLLFGHALQCKESHEVVNCQVLN